MLSKNSQVIVRRRPKKAHNPHHGGHWKVAYADFMTAMMAFFLLLWILSVSDENKLEGIAQYFTPTEHPAGRPGGEGVLQGSAVAEQQNVLAEPAEEMKAESGAPNPWAKLADESKRSDTTPLPLGEALERAGEQFLKEVQAQPALANLAGNLLVRQIEGQLVVDILDLGNGAMFAEGTATPSASLKLVLGALAPTVAALPHPIRITGHTDGGGAEGGAEGWALSAARAQAVLAELLALGIDARRFTLIAGAADSRPLDPLLGADPRNRRVTLELGSALD